MLNTFYYQLTHTTLKNVELLKHSKINVYSNTVHDTHAVQTVYSNTVHDTRRTDSIL